MKKLWKGAVALVFFGLLIAISGPGCVDNESSLFIRNVLAPSCSLKNTDSPFILQGVFDTRYSCQYSALMVAGNQLVRRGDDNKLQTETSRIEIKGIDVQVLDGNGAVLGEFSEPAVGFVDPANNTNAGLGITGGLLIDGKTGQLIDEQGLDFVVAHIIVRGRTLGGQDLSSAPWDFPIQVCNGCLCQAPSDDTCVLPNSAPKEQCLIVQDRAFDCRFIGVGCDYVGSCGQLHAPP